MVQDSFCCSRTNHNTSCCSKIISNDCHKSSALQILDEWVEHAKKRQQQTKKQRYFKREYLSRNYLEILIPGFIRKFKCDIYMPWDLITLIVDFSLVYTY